MVQQVTEETTMILAGGFPRRRDDGTHPLPTPGALGSRRSPRGWEGAGAWVKARLVYLVERGAAGRFCGCCTCTSHGIRGWSPFPHSASPIVLPAPLCCAPAWAKMNCLYLCGGSDDAGRGVKEGNEEILPCSGCQEDGSCCSRHNGPGSECSRE